MCQDLNLGLLDEKLKATSVLSRTSYDPWRMMSVISEVLHYFLSLILNKLAKSRHLKCLHDGLLKKVLTINWPHLLSSLQKNGAKIKSPFWYLMAIEICYRRWPFKRYWLFIRAQLKKESLPANGLFWFVWRLSVRFDSRCACTSFDFDKYFQCKV